jgi:hypothetical protein
MYLSKDVLKPTIKNNSKNGDLPAQYRTNYSKFDYKEAMDSLNALQARDDDMKLIGLIRYYFITHPSTLPYNLKKPKALDPSEGQTAIIDKLLNKKVEYSIVLCLFLTHFKK